MKPHTPDQASGIAEYIPHIAEALPEHHYLRTARHYAAALLAGFSVAGPVAAEANTNDPAPLPASANGGATYVSSNTEQYDCTTDFNFRVGIQDDNQFVWQQNIKRDEAFRLAAKIFGASVLRINVIYGMVEKYGLQQYVDTVRAATRHGFQTQVTLVPTPAYEPTLNQKLSYNNPNPEVMEKFAHRVAKALGPKVVLWSVFNEPNNPWFYTGSMQKYNAAVEAGETGILASNPRAQIASGELAANDLNNWFDDAEEQSGKEIEIHPYGDALLQMKQYAQRARHHGKTLLLSEYGNPVGPGQLARDRQAINIAACDGVGELIFYQLVRNPDASWDTGVVNPPRHHKKAATMK